MVAAQRAQEDGSGVAVVKNKMIDRPVIQRADKIIHLAQRMDLLIPEPNI